MRRLIMWNMMLLDGCFEGSAAWALDFHQKVWGPELEAHSLRQLDGAAGLVFGRRTYEGMAAYWQAAEGEIAWRMNALPKTVCSRTLAQADWNNSRIAADGARGVAELKRDGDGDLYLFGSAELARTLVRERLIDEYRLCVVPAVAESGRQLFGPEAARLDLRLLEARPLQSGGVIVRYEDRRAG